MNVTLNIQEDAELRAHIKDAIRGQVLSIVRDELSQILKDEIVRKVKGTNSYSFDNIIKDSTKSVIKDILYREHHVSSWSSEFITPIVTALVNDAIAGKDWKNLVDKIAKEKIKSLIG